MKPKGVICTCANNADSSFWLSRDTVSLQAMWHSRVLPLLLLGYIYSPANALIYGIGNTPPVNCAAVLCAKPDCTDFYTPPNQCCPICRPAGKPGTCPNFPSVFGGFCIALCDSDSECNGDLKCCMVGCLRVCMSPEVKGSTCTYNGKVYADGSSFKDDCNTCSCSGGYVSCTEIGCLAKKPGECPVAPPGTITICLVECGPDSDCPGDQKCCNFGCRSSCTPPVGRPCVTDGKTYQDGETFRIDCNGCSCRNGSVVCTLIACDDKPGVCPAVKPGTVGICVEQCSSDSDCSGDQKCCSKGCGHVCTSPAGKPCVSNGKTYQDGETFKDACNTCTCRNGIPLCTLIACQGKPGMCPILPPDTIGTCVVLCGSDYDCPGSQKCCSHGCGRSCTNPDGGSTGCVVNGKKYKEGDTLPRDPKDPCKRCTCTGGSVKCDQIMCPACAGYKPPGACCNICDIQPIH